MRTAFIVLLSLFAVSAAVAAPGDIVCDVRVDSDFRDLPPIVIREGFTVDLGLNLIRVAPIPGSPWNLREAAYQIALSRRLAPNSFAVQAMDFRNRRAILLEIEYLQGTDAADMTVGNVFGAQGPWLKFGKSFRFYLERCSGLERFQRG